jgi:hypothetical protein
MKKYLVALVVALFAAGAAFAGEHGGGDGGGCNACNVGGYSNFNNNSGSTTNISFAGTETAGSYTLTGTGHMEGHTTVVAANFTSAGGFDGSSFALSNSTSCFNAVASGHGNITGSETTSWDSGGLATSNGTTNYGNNWGD